MDLAAMALEAAQLLAGGRVPQPDQAVVPAGNKGFAVGGESHAPDERLAEAYCAETGDGPWRQRVAVAVGADLPLFPGLRPVAAGSRGLGRARFLSLRVPGR